MCVQYCSLEFYGNRVYSMCPLKYHDKKVLCTWNFRIREKVCEPWTFRTRKSAQYMLPGIAGLRRVYGMLF